MFVDDFEGWYQEKWDCAVDGHIWQAGDQRSDFICSECGARQDMKEEEE